MTVICLTNCPPKLRGDLTKWLIEINTGVYVGNLSARVRDELWDRITENIRSGQATMVFRAAGEQHMDFRVHNTTWIPVDYDGLKLIMRPNESTGKDDDRLADGFSRAAKIRKARRMQRTAASKDDRSSYTVVDVETTGLKCGEDEIIEIAALRIRAGTVSDSFSCLVKSGREISGDIRKLTGITEDMLRDAGLPLKTVLESFTAFIGADRLVCWNAPFDLAFLQVGCSRCGLPIPRNRVEDAMKLARKSVKALPDHRLTSVAQYFGIDTGAAHRALQDCFMTYAVYEKLNGFEPGEL